MAIQEKKGLRIDRTCMIERAVNSKREKERGREGETDVDRDSNK